MVNWFEKKSSSSASDLSSPLLPHGTSDYNNDNRTTSQKQRDINMAFATQAVATQSPPNNNNGRGTSTGGRRGSTGRRSAYRDSRSSRRYKLNQIQKQSTRLSRQLSNMSADSSMVTYQIDNLHSSTSSMYADQLGWTRTESEVSDYGIDDVVKPNNQSSGQSSNETKETTKPISSSSATIIEESDSNYKMTSSDQMKLALVILITSCGIGSYVAAFISSMTIYGLGAASTVMVGVAGGISVAAVTPLVWVGEWRLVHMPGLRKRINRMKDLARRFQREIDILVAETEYLREEVEDIQESNAALEKIVKANGGNVDQMIALVQENQVLLASMKENIRQVVLQDVVKLVLQSDLNRDGTINKREANILAKRLAISLEIYGIVFDTEKFHRAVGLSPSICGVLTIVRRLLPDEHGETRASFYDDIDEDDDEEDDVYDMFYVPVERETLRGCAESIHMAKEYTDLHGERPSLISISPCLRKSMHGLRVSVSSFGLEESKL